MTTPLNLASQPFRNQALPALLFGLGCVALAAASAQHAVTLRRLLEQRSAGTGAEAVALGAEARRLRRETEAIRVPTPSAGAVAEWRAVKTLVDRRAFSWTELLGSLERILPAGVRLLAITPAVRDGRLRLDLRCVARTREDALAFLERMQQRPEFEDVQPQRFVTGTDGTAVEYSLAYAPERARPAREGA